MAPFDAPSELAVGLHPERMLETLRLLLHDLKTPELAEKILTSVKGLSELESKHGAATHSVLRAARCLAAFEQLDNMDVTDLIKQKTAQSMVTGFTSIQMFFGMLPSPERHNASKNYDELAGLYRMPAKVLAARSGLQLDPFKSSDPEASTILKTVVESMEKMGPSRMFVPSQGDDEGVADLEAGLARLALGYTPIETGESLASVDLPKHEFLTYLRWVVQGRKLSSSPFAPQGVIEETATRSPGDENLSTLSDGRVSGICASCGSQHGTHKCKLCLITLEDYGSEHTVSATTYCNESCRNSHFEAHKAACKETRKLARSSILFKKAFHHYLQVANGVLPISAITLVQGIVTKHYVPTFNTTDSARDLADSQWQAEAAMNGFACGDIVTWARPIFEFLIQPCCASVEFVNHSVKHADIAVANHTIYGPVHHIRYNTLRLHMVARLTLPSGPQFAFDPTAAQFGWKEYLVPWNEYVSRRVHHIEAIVAMESFNGAQSLTGESAMLPTSFTSLFSAKEEAAMKLVKIFRTRKGGLRAILKLPEHQFQEARNDLANAMEESVRKLTR